MFTKCSQGHDEISFIRDENHHIPCPLCRSMAINAETIRDLSEAWTELKKDNDSLISENHRLMGGKADGEV